MDVWVRCGGRTLWPYLWIEVWIEVWVVCILRVSAQVFMCVNWLKHNMASSAITLIEVTDDL